jgi:flagellar biosynthesis protein FlhF
LSPRAQRDQAAVLDGGRRHLRRRIVTAGMFGAAEMSKDQPAAICLVGATGVGKTTALTKLAAGLRDRYTIGFVTTDTYRVAAAAQLLAYADILGLPAATAYTPLELAEQCAGLVSKGVDLILVDTPGRNPRSQEQLEELRSFLDVVPNKSVHLAVSAAAGQEEMLHIAQRFSVCPLHGLMLTKTDEAEHLGAAFNLMRETGLPLTFVSSGQRAPEDLCQATPERIAGLILPDDATLGDSEQP